MRSQIKRFLAIRAAEKAAAGGDVEAVMQHLRALTLDDFSKLIFALPDPGRPNLSRVLPAMADEAVQVAWTGNSGEPLREQSVRFIKSVREGYEDLTGKPVSHARVLDYGCGYGRLLRLMMHLCPVDQLVGCDPGEDSIRICEEDGLPCRVDLTGFLPESLPYEPQSFDLLYAFSVFTHTSPRATQVGLAALRKVTAPDGVLVITIRPEEYWSDDARYTERADSLRQLHRDQGFAFVEHGWEPVEGERIYGDTSLSLDYLASIAPGWEIAASRRPSDDENQVLVFLTPA